MPDASTGHDTHPHLLLIVGIGGLPAPDALRTALRVTPRVSVLFVTAWADPAELREQWERTAGNAGGEFLDVPDLDSAVTAGLTLSEGNPVSGVVTYSEVLLQPQARLVEALGLPGNTVEAVSVAQSKARQREVFARHAVPAPRFAVLHDETELLAAAEGVGLPAVLKPSLGAGSKNVRKVRTQDDLITTYREAQGSKTAFLQHDEAYLLEEPLPVEGHEDSRYANYVSVETLLFEGKADHLAVSDRLRLRHGYVEEGLVLPSHLTSETIAEVTDCAGQAIQAIGLTHGAVHTEIALTPKGPRVIEVNARAGGPIPKMLLAAAEYDFAADIARVALGLRPGPAPRFTGVAWFRFVPVPHGQWRVVSQRTAQEARQTFPELTQISLRFAPGQAASRNNTQHLASFTLAAATAEEAGSIAADVERFLAITLEPLGVPADGATEENRR
ncbi:acetyl-CoA carboxylase biotin carboxylase subunit family protein [Streptomyces abikoensis]|uniref:Acetyl-CoA carboxylase biotin carboxylase subunit family protein n=1 Tax=Streptomyces abikoensis TaxID=97398 RepID=A0ABW7TFT0_9ACTN